MRRPKWARTEMPVSRTGYVLCGACQAARFRAVFNGESTVDATCPRHKPLSPDHWSKVFHPSNREEIE